MIKKQNYLIDFNSLNPALVSEYLDKHGWSEESKIDSRASILTITKNDKKYSILLPLDPEIPDFSSRMQDVVRTLEVVEDRPKAEIIKAWQNVDEVAVEKNCEILSLRFGFIDEANKSVFSAYKMGKVLVSLQDLCSAFGQTQKKQISDSKKEILEKTELSVFDTFQGSFGIKLAFPPNQGQLSLLGTPVAEKVADTLINLVNLSENSDRQKLKEYLRELKRNVASKYRRFLVSLIKAESNLDIDWGSVNTRGGGHASLSHQNTINTVEFINQMEIESPDEYTIIGELVMANKIKNRIEIEDIEDGKKYGGTLSTNSVIQQIELTIGKLYSVTFQEVTSLNPTTGEEKIERSVSSITYYH